MAATEPDRYRDPSKYEAYVAAYLGMGMTEDDARTNLERRGFNMPPMEGEVETVSMAETSAAAAPMASESTPELDNWMRLMDPDLPIPTEQEFQQAGTEMEEDVAALDKMSPFRESQYLGEPNPLNRKQRERNEKITSTLFGQRSSLVGGRPLGEIPETVTVEEEPETEEAALVEGTIGTGDQGDEETITKTETVSDPDARQISLWRKDVGGTITNPVKKSVFDQATEFINEMKVPEIGTEGGFYFFGDNKQDYLMLREKIDTEIDKYESTIQAVAAEQQKPPLEGANKWIAILGVALGAAGSALTGTPNEAMQMLEGFMDREQQKFLKSKEMKMKSADQQRLDLIRRRGELLQQFQNETNRVLQISEFQLTKTTALANIKKIQEDLQQKMDQNAMENQIAVAKILKDVIIAQSTVRAKMTAEERKGIAPNMGTNPGEIGVSMLVGAARDKVMKEVVDFNRVYWGVSRAYDSVKDIIQKDKAGALSPEALSAARSDLVQRVTEIKLYAAKKLFQFGAALTKNEEALLDQIIGDANRMNVALGITETRMKNFMGIMEDKRLALRDAGGFSTLGGTTGVENQKTDPGVIEARGTVRNK